MKATVQKIEAMPYVELPLLEYALIVRAVRASSLSDAIATIRKWHRVKIWGYAAIGMTVGILVGYALGT